VETLTAAQAASLAELEQAKRTARTAGVWAAAQKADAVKEAVAAAAVGGGAGGGGGIGCPAPVPPLTTLAELVTLLQQEDTKAVVELGCGAPHSLELLKGWVGGVSFLNVSLACVPAAGSDPAAKPELRPGWSEFHHSMMDMPVQVRPPAFGVLGLCPWLSTTGVCWCSR
jgi:hypothetical protein